MRFLLLLLSLILQLNISGFANHNPQENHVIETHTSPKHRLSVTINRNVEYKIDCTFRFQGQYEDSETGLYYNRFRYYSPDEGMYLSQDPIGLNGGNNLYGYFSNPNTWIDVFGLEKIKNKVDGDAREAIALVRLQQEHPNVTILKERYFRDETGKSIKDIGIGAGGIGQQRRIDFVVIEDGKVVQVVEVTSSSADKRLQFEKEGRIKGGRGNLYS